MGTQTTFMLNTHFKLVNKTLVYDFLYKNMFLFLSSIWVFITTYTLYLLSFLSRNLFRFHVGDSIEKEELKLNSPAFPLLQEVKQVESNCLELEPEPEPEPEPAPEVVEYEEKEYNGFIEEDTEKETATLSSFSFKFKSYEDTRRSNGGFEDYGIPEKAFIMNTNTSKYQFLPGKDFNGFIEEPKVVSFSVEQLYVDLNDKLESLGNQGFSSEEKFLQSNLEIGDRVEELVSDTHRVEYPEKPESLVLTEVQLPEKDKLVSVESSLSSSSKEEISDGVQSVLKKEFSGFDSEPQSESTSFGGELSVRNHVIESNSEEFSSIKDFEEGTDIDNMIDFDEVKLKAMEDIHSFEETHFDNSNDMDKGVTDTSEQSSFVQNRSVANLSTDMEVKIELMEEIESILETEFLNESEVGENKKEQELEQCNGEREEPMDYSEKSQEPSLQEDSSLSGSEDSNGLEIWEHQDLIEQLKMELKKVRATGLPTILEESEYPKVVDDLKPWKIEEKFLHEDRIDELHKFYKIYRERMRKFDILNYQKMYAIGFLQLKDPLQTMSCKKSAIPTLTSVLSHNFGLSKRKSTEDDTSAKFMTELQNDLEMIYVGQLSLSWEFLHWQYQKARELLDSDPYETRRYNQVAGEFQQFQVLMQRFMENELFQGPRVQNYIKNRCILRNLLQVPVIKEDSRDKEGRKQSKDAITCSLLLMVIEESMRIFWEFLRADKNAGIVMFKGFLGTQVELHDPSDSELLLEVQTTLQKKDRKLKELMRIGNCIIRRFQKNHRHQDGGGRSNQVILYSQVDLKLVSRVVNMSRITTDQLVWCRKKLDKITLVDRKIHIEPSFLPFPC